MRLLAVGALTLLCLACSAPDPASGPPPTTPTVVTINPARIDRARGALPEDYEVSTHTGPLTPISLWGFTDTALSQPAACRPLAAPAIDPASARAWSASGPGGIVYAVVAGAPAQEVPGPTLLADCAHWTVASGHTTGTVAGVPAPDIDGARTVGMSTAATTVVEGGTETHSHADTFVAYLGDYVCFVALVTDPGSTYPTLDSAFAADLLVETVSALRG